VRGYAVWAVETLPPHAALFFLGSHCQFTLLVTHVKTRQVSDVIVIFPTPVNIRGRNGQLLGQAEVCLPALATPIKVIVQIVLMQKSSSQQGTHDLLLPGLLGLAWVACAALINPIGDFPLNDDWAFGLPVEVLLRDRALRFTDWQSPTLIAQVFWGSLYCLPTGFSFTALRISTLTCGLAGLIGMYYLLLHLGANCRSAAFGTAVFAFNPFYLCLSYSFMTDVPFLSLMILAMLLLLRGVDRGHDGEVVLGLALACLSTFIRQIGLIVLIGFLVAYPLRRGFGKRWVLLAIVPAALSVALLWLYERYLRAIGELPGLYTVKADAVKNLVQDLVHLRLGALKPPITISVLLPLYLGLWALPYALSVTPTVLGRFTRARRRATWLLVAGVTVGITTPLTLSGWLMPMVGNQLKNFGMGLRSLSGVAPSGLPRPFWIGITALAVTGAALIILTLGEFVREKWLTRSTAFAHESWPWQVVFLLVVGAFNFAPIAFAYGAVFDRYFLVFLPLLLGLLVALGHGQEIMRGPLVMWLSASVMATYLVFGVAATHDYLGWNRARWAAAAELHERWGVPKEEIDGGFEYNNLLDSRERLRTRWVHRPGVVEVIQEPPSRPFRLAFEPLASYEILSHVECQPWLPHGVRRIYYLRRLSAGPLATSPEPDSTK